MRSFFVDNFIITGNKHLTTLKSQASFIKKPVFKSACQENGKIVVVVSGKSS